MQNNPQQNICKKLLYIAAVAMLLVVATLTLYALGYRCPARAVLGMPCPGCGMTTAMLRLAALDLRGAAAAHQLYWLPPMLAVGLGAAYLGSKLTARLLAWAMAASCVLLLGSWLIGLL